MATTSLMRQRTPFLAQSDEETREIVLDDHEQEGLVQDLSNSLDHSALICVPLILPSPTRSFLLALLIRLCTIAPLAFLSFLLLVAEHQPSASSDLSPPSPTCTTSASPSPPTPTFQLPLLHVLLLFPPLFISLFTFGTDWRWSTPLLTMGLGVEVSRTIKTQQDELMGLQRLKYRFDGA
ncbi:BZ3500_MvSof-1268-A1-R1_Chr10-2g02959 [Microbotryum saponariae]|uniref:BZ3500_MvSof-1268-A1-R1_Chr10-2g02959 protein n=1 Tax=Microbotryum saponariae TaxID=289078 RepID=A0A2X0KQM3_9BASI|nr:BZ3501_MvSof-1269-A2-R1_Chr10-2g02545 [Microbotryum saponariae]SDA01822.1 BZ3500_MvSof-1268-A1-R1_Chr10-2g02959 [Microbotryum saponariae]